MVRGRARRRRADPWIHTVEGTEAVGRARGARYDPLAGIVAGYVATYPDGVPVHDPSVSVASRGDAGEPAWIWERGDGARVPNRGDPHVHAAAVAAGADTTGGAEGAYYRGADAESIAASLAASFPNGAPPGTQGAYPSGTHPGGGAFAGTWWAGEVDNDNSLWRASDDSRRRWDVLPEVYAAIQTNRASRVGRNASFTDLAWCLASLTEILIRADYYGADAYAKTPNFATGKNAMGPGETVRLDHVMLSAKDRTRTTPGCGSAREHAAFMAYADRCARDYKVQFLADYFAEYAEALRLSICNGNGVPPTARTTPTGARATTRGAARVRTAVPGVRPRRVRARARRRRRRVRMRTRVGGDALRRVLPALRLSTRRVRDGRHHGPPVVRVRTRVRRGVLSARVPAVRLRTRPVRRANVLGAFPGDAATCDCVDPDRRTGLLCELECPGTAPGFCGNGECRHALWGRAYESTTEAERQADVAACACDVGWVGLFSRRSVSGGRRIRPRRDRRRASEGAARWGPVGWLGACACRGTSGRAARPPSASAATGC